MPASATRKTPDQIAGTSAGITGYRSARRATGLMSVRIDSIAMRTRWPAGGGAAPVERAPDDHAELRLVVHSRRARREENRIAGPDHGGRGFDEQAGRVGDVVAELLGVLRVVACDRDDLPRCNRREQLHAR